MNISRPTFVSLSSDHLAVLFTLTYGIRGVARCAWYNMGDPDEHYTTLRIQTFTELDRLADVADVIAVCEVLDRIPFLPAWGELRGFKVLVREHADVAILWRKGVRVTRRQAVELVKACHVEAGPGGRRSVARWSMRIRLGWWPTGTNLYTGHMISAAGSGPARASVYSRHVAKLVNLIGPRRHAVLVMDANQNPGSHRLHPIKQAGFVQHVHTRTHAHGIYDQVWSRG